MRWLAGIVLAGAVLRVVGIDGQSFWRDEASTVMGLSGGLGDAFDWVANQEAQPPGYFALAWLWTQVFGDGEVGLRSLSALAGIATIPVAFAIGRTHSHRTGLVAAALVATNPFLVWYSQEGRSYALLVLFAALATLKLVRDRPRACGLWASAALLVHYHAIFLLVPQALVLLHRHRRRAIGALIPPVVTGLALLPLVLSQRDGRVEGIPYESLGGRIADVAKHWTAGPLGTSADVLAAIAIVIVALGLALAVRRRLSRTVLATAVLAVGVPVLLSALGADYFNDRYVIAALVPVLAVVAAGLARKWVLGAALAALFAGFTISIAVDEERQRDDWRAVVGGLAPAAIVATGDGDRALRVYGAETLSADTATRLVFVASWRFGRPRPPNPVPPPGFTLAAREENPTTTVVRFEAATPMPIQPDAVAAGWRLYGEPPVLLELP